MSPTTRGSRRPYARRVPEGQRREQLLDAALEVIVRDGYESVSIDAISRQAGVTRPVVYGVFRGLGDLLTTLLDRQQARAVAQLFDVLAADPSGADPQQFVGHVVRALIETVRGDPLTWHPILLAPHGTPPEVRARIEVDRERVRRQFVLLVEGHLAAQGGSGADAELIGHLLLATAEYFGRLLLEHPEQVDAEALVALVESIVGAAGAGRPASPG